jgi:hypothetical protein
MSELKACPFCGGKVHEENSDYYAGIICEDCSYGWSYEGTEDPILEKQKWNTRPLESDLQSALTTAQEENERMRDLLRDIVLDCMFVDEQNTWEARAKEISDIAQSALNGGKNE